MNRQQIVNYYYNTGSSQATADTTADGKQAFLIVADSIGAGLTGHTASALPASGTAYEYDRNTNTIINFGDGAGVNGFSFNTKSPWAKFCIDYNAATGKKPVIINRGASSSTISPALSGLIGNDWQTTGTNYNLAVTAANDCLTKLGLTKLKGILVILGINDVQGQSGTDSFTVAQISAYFDTLISNLISQFGSDVPILVTAIGITNTIRVDSRLSGVRNFIKQKTISVSNVYMSCTLQPFFVNGYYESDNIHPNVTGNDHAGAMFARWFKNDTYTKSARSIISCHFEDLPTSDKAKVQTFMSSFESTYQSANLLYLTKPLGTLRANATLDWAFLNGPDTDGGFSFTSGVGVSTNGSSTLFNLGHNQLNSAIDVTTSDYFMEVKLGTVTSTGVTACAIGIQTTGPTRAMFVRALNTGGVNWAAISTTSNTYATDTNIVSNASYAVNRASGNESLLKNGSVVQGPTANVAATIQNFNYYLGALNSAGTAAQFLNAVYERVMIIKQSAIANKSAFITALNALQA